MYEFKRLIVASGALMLMSPGSFAEPDDARSPCLGWLQTCPGYLLEQTLDAAELLQRLPFAGPGHNSGQDGAALFELFGLGPNRTLVLLDGRRLVPFDLDGQADANSIPMALVERIDVVLGGASAVYGSDAIAGVVNFVSKRDFSGISGVFQAGSSEHGDAQSRHAQVTLGGNFAGDRGNVALTIDSTNTDPLTQGERPMGRVSLSSYTGQVVNSGTTVPARIFGENSLDGQIQPDGRIGRPIVGFNFAPDALYQIPLERLQAQALARLEIADRLEVYSQVNFTHSELYFQQAASGTFFSEYFVPIGNPFIPEPSRQQICVDSLIAAVNCRIGNTREVQLTFGRRFVEQAPRMTLFETESFQYAFGLRGDLTEDWSYDAYGSVSESDQLRTLHNFGSSSRVQQALRAVSRTDCLDPANACVPLDLFGPAGSISPEMLEFINLDSLRGQSVQQTVASAYVNGPVAAVKSAWADYPVNAVLGVEARRLSASSWSDQAAREGGEVLSTRPAAAEFGGNIKLLEAYTEFLVPLVTDRFLLQHLSFEAGYRLSAFNSTDRVNYGSYKFGGSWVPADKWRLRGLWQSATRAPNIRELYEPVRIEGDYGFDACVGPRTNVAQANTAGTLSNLCRLSGVPLNWIGRLPDTTGEVTAFIQGNPQLRPEKARSRTIGLTWSPSRQFSMAFDYIDISIADAIVSPSPADIVAACFDPSLNPGLQYIEACRSFRRDPLYGSIYGSGSGIDLRRSNLGTAGLRGVSLALQHVRFSSFGQWQFSLLANRALRQQSRAAPLRARLDCLGYFGVNCGIGNHRLQMNGLVNWSYQELQAGLNWRYLSALRVEPTSSILPGFSRISALSYFDLLLGWQFSDALRASLVINNALDQQAPVIGDGAAPAAFNSGNTLPFHYDSVGRFYTLGLSFAF